MEFSLCLLSAFLEMTIGVAVVLVVDFLAEAVSAVVVFQVAEEALVAAAHPPRGKFY